MSWEETSEPGEATQTLADQMGMAVEEFIDLFGAGWQPVPNAGHDFDADPSGDGYIFGQWYIAGDPFQLMLRVRSELEGVEVARPKGSWAGQMLVYRPDTDSEIIPRHEGWQDTVGQVIQALLRRRRSSFRYCRYCWQISAPENRHDDACHGCASRWHGMVF